MDLNKNYKIALVLYTRGIDYDDRVRKEVNSIQELYPNVKFKIFAVEAKNREESGITSYGVPYMIPFLKSREKYPSGTHTLAKAWDFYKSIRKDLKSFDAIWCADPETFLFVLLISGKPILWDLHELPMALIGNPVKKALFQLLERKCKVMVHANEERLNYLHELGFVKQMEKQFYLRNYPQFNEIDNEYDETFHSFKEWKGESKCVYLQGIADEKRADMESIAAVLSFPEMKGVVVGRILPERMEVFKQRFGEEALRKCLFFTGQIKQLKTPQYIKECFLSLVFYKNVNPNNWYCEPNRLFQSIINGIPVIVGENPPMKELVEKYKVGICANTDGTDQVKITEAMKQAMQRYDNLKDNLENNGGNLLWNSQNEMMRRIVNAFIK
jgi:glycosyltransferase involved in cell wall biosynthesis